MVSFGDSKHRPVNPLQSLLELLPLKSALSAKCTIHAVVQSCFFFSVRTMAQTHSLTSFGLSVGSWGLAICVTAALT